MEPDGAPWSRSSITRSSCRSFPLHAKFELGAETDPLHAMLECAGETDLPNTVSESFLKLLEVRSVGRSVPVERVQRAEAGFKNSSCGASSSVVCDSLSATRVESPSSRVQRVNACMACMLHVLFRIHRIRWEMGLYEDGVSAYLGQQSH